MIFVFSPPPLPPSGPPLRQVLGLAVIGDHIYWTDRDNTPRSMGRAEKRIGMDPTALLSSSFGLGGIVAVNTTARIGEWCLPSLLLSILSHFPLLFISPSGPSTRLSPFLLFLLISFSLSLPPSLPPSKYSGTSLILMPLI